MISKLINDLKKDKKKMILVIAVIIVLVILIMPKNKNTQTAGFGTELSNILNNDYYSGTGTLTMCNYNFDLSASKSSSNYQIGISNDDIDYTELLTRYNDNIYLNYSLFTQKGGIATVKCATPTAEEDSKNEENTSITLKEIFLESLNSQYFSFTSEENYKEGKLTGDENWKGYWEYLSEQIKENKERILENYTDKGAISDELEVLISDIDKLANSTATGNYLTLTLSTAENEETLFTVDASIDFTSLPTFVSQDSFDANQFTIYASINYRFTENTVNVPQGYVYALGTDNINNFVTQAWNSVFGRKTYTATNAVTVKSDSVTNVIDLGSTTETYQYLFDKDGISDGLLIVSSHDKNIIYQYQNKYVGNTDDESIIYDASNKNFSYSISLSEDALDSINKISTTPNGLAAYLKTAEGVVPIV